MKCGPTDDAQSTTFSHWEKVAKGRMRAAPSSADGSAPDPPLRGTISHGEKV